MRLLKYLILLSSTVTLGVIARTGTSSSDKSVNTSKKLQIAACSAGEVRKTCRSKCEPTCFSSSKCSTVCTSIPVCVCQDGFVRHEGICIPQPACQFFARAVKKSHKRSSSKPKKIKPTTKKPQKRKPTTPKTTLATAPPEIIVKPDHPPPSCGKGQAFTLCVCDATCEKGKVCKSCKSGCGCFRHFVRNSHGQCVAFEECPLPRSPFKPVAIIAEEKTGGSLSQ